MAYQDQPISCERVAKISIFFTPNWSIAGFSRPISGAALLEKTGA
jgi:hypothetical protein